MLFIQGRKLAVVTKAAMFDNLSRSMEKAWKMVSKDGKLTPENIKEPLKEIRRALLEADVSLPVVRRFIKKVEETALGKEVSREFAVLHLTTRSHEGLSITCPWMAWCLAA